MKHEREANPFENFIGLAVETNAADVSGIQIARMANSLSAYPPHPQPESHQLEMESSVSRRRRKKIR